MMLELVLQRERLRFMLTSELERECEKWAAAIEQDSVVRGLEDHKVSSRPGYALHLTGERGQAAVSLYIGVPYLGRVGSFKGPDMPFNIEVRTVTQRYHGCKVRPMDDDAKRVVMVFEAEDRALWVVGWIGAKEGKRYPLKSPEKEPYHRVPPEELRLMAELKRDFWRNY